MKTYETKYVIQTVFEAESDEEAEKINEKNLNAIFKNGEFYVKKFKLKTNVWEGIFNK